MLIKHYARRLLLESKPLQRGICVRALRKMQAKRYRALGQPRDDHEPPMQSEVSP